MRTEIQNIRSRLSDTQLFGFGSFFAGDVEFADIDLLAVFPDDGEQSMRSYHALLAHLQDFQRQFDIRVDVTALTAAEFETGPLQDMHALVPINPAFRGA